MAAEEQARGVAARGGLRLEATLGLLAMTAARPASAAPRRALATTYSAAARVAVPPSTSRKDR
jgi:hypothetical protein